MIYNFRKDLVKIPSLEFNKNTPKETLQYCIGGLLYCPATNKKIANKIINSEINCLTSIAFCLEDAIGDGQVKEAEENLKAILQTLDENKDTFDMPLIFIRVREPKQIMRLYKKCGDLLNLITGFLLPKFNKDNMQKYIENFHKVKDKLETAIYMLPIIESKNAIYIQNRTENLLQIRECLDLVKDEVLNIRVGGADFCNIFGVRRKSRQSIWDIRVVSNCLSDIINMFSQDYIVSGAVWEYFEGEDDKETSWITGLKEELFLDKLNGMIGKTCIHPSQLEVVQKSLSVLKEDYEDAMQIVEASVSKVGVVKGKNKMNELRTHSNWARKVLAMANIYGVRDCEI